MLSLILIHQIYYNQQSMLNYHRITPQSSTTTNARFDHFLTLGSHRSSYDIHSLFYSLTLIQLHPQHKFISQNQGKEGISMAITLKGQSRINEKNTKPYQLVIKPKYFQQVKKQKSIILFLLLKLNEEQLENSEEYCLQKGIIFEKEKIPSIRVTTKTIKNGQKLPQKSHFATSMLVFIDNGKLTHQQTQQQFGTHECMFLPSCHTEEFKAQTDTSLIVFELK